MTHRFLAAAAVILVPAGIVGAEPTQGSKDYSTKKICTVNTTIGTRLGNTRTCRTKSEHDAMKAEARRTVDRIQHQKPLTCDGPGVGGIRIC